MPYVSVLCKMVHPRDGHRKVLMMIDNYSYLDESGIHGGAEVCLTGGYFGAVEAWEAFERAWQEVLGKFALSEFHAKNVLKRRDSVPLQWALAEVIARSEIYPVALAVAVKEFFKLSLIERRFMTGATLTPDGKIKESGNPNRPYFAPFQQVVRRVLSYTPEGNKAHFFLGLDTTFSSYATDLYRKLKDVGAHPYQSRFGTIAYPAAKDTPGLQAADFMVHVVYQDVLRRVRNGRFFELEQPADLIRLLLNNFKAKDDVAIQDAYMMRETMKQIPMEQRGELLKEDLA